MTFSRKETNTVLAALTLYAEVLQSGVMPSAESMQEIRDIADDGVDFASPEEVNDLADRINVVPRYETTRSIGEWIDVTFPGGDPDSPRKSVRLLEEAVELCRASGASWEEIEKAVGVVRGEGRPDYAERRPQPDKVPGEAADVAIVLHGLCHLKGIDLQAEIDKKMAVNRARRWRALGDGTGYHIKEPADGNQDAGRGDQPEAGAAGDGRPAV